MQALERFDAVVAVMNADEARACVTRINNHMNSARLELLRLYEGRGWAALGYASWRECVTAEFQASKTRVYELLSAGQIERELSAIADNSIPESQIRPLAAFIERPRGPNADERPTVIHSEAIRAAWDEANARTGGKPTARVVEDVVREMRGEAHASEEDAELHFDPAAQQAYCKYCYQTHGDWVYDGFEAQAWVCQHCDHATADQFMQVIEEPEPEVIPEIIKAAAPRVNAGLFTSATPEWYTPKHVVDRVIRVFDGFISLDPCSNSGDFETANVPALNYWTQAEDGLVQPWHGNVYMNPPYGDVIGDWVRRMCDAFESEEIDAAIALLPGRIDTAWFQLLNRYPICCVRGRLRFSGSENSAPFPSVVVYLGYNPDAFITQFRDIGPIRPAALD